MEARIDNALNVKTKWSDLEPVTVPLPQAFPRILGEAPRDFDKVYDKNTGNIDYEATYLKWSKWNGYAILKYCSVCTITHELNGMYELYIEVDMKAPHVNEIKIGRVVSVLASPTETTDPELFRIYKVEFDENEVYRIYAQHISYDLNGVQVPAVATGDLSASEMFYWLSVASVYPGTEYTNPFIFRVDPMILGHGALSGNNTTLMEHLLGEKGFLEQLNGEVERVRNRFFIYDEGTIGGYNSILKGSEVPFEVHKNVSAFSYSVDNSEAITHFIPFIKYNWEVPQVEGDKGSNASKELYITMRQNKVGWSIHRGDPIDIVDANTDAVTTYNYIRTVPVDFTTLMSSDDFDYVKGFKVENNVRSELATRLNKKVTALKKSYQSQKVYRPAINLEVNLVELRNTPEFMEMYYNHPAYQHMRLGGRLLVRFPDYYPLREAEMRITKVEYNVLAREYNRFEAKMNRRNGLLFPSMGK